MTFKEMFLAYIWAAGLFASLLSLAGMDWPQLGVVFAPAAGVAFFLRLMVGPAK